MPYKNNSDLPEPVRHVLPEHAQLIFRKTFNNAIKEYHSEETAMKVAWSAVKKEYEKKDDKWIKKS